MSRYIKISVSLYKGESHVAGMLIKHTQASQEAVRIEVRCCCFCCNPFWASENRQATREQLHGTFHRILSSDLPGAACGFPLGAHTPSWNWASRSYTFPGPSIKAKNFSEVIEKLFFMECNSLTRISLCLWISLCSQLFSRLIAAMATAHLSKQTQA